MKKNQIDCFDINGGALVYKQNKVKKAINGKSLLVALQNYYKNDTKSAEELTKHILDSREEKIKERGFAGCEVFKTKNKTFIKL